MFSYNINYYGTILHFLKQFQLEILRYIKYAIILNQPIFQGGPVNKTTFLLCMLLVLIPVISESKIIQFPLDDNTLGKVIENATDGDIVLLADGTTHMCTETIRIDKDITIKSDGNAKGCTILFQGNGQFRFTQPGRSVIPKLGSIKFMKAENTAIYIESASPEFEGCTFTENSGVNGGAVSIKNGQPLFSECYFLENNAQNGGAFYLDENAKVAFNACKMYTNTAVINGGGLYINKSSAMFVSTNIYYNTADTGGGIFMNESSLSFADCGINSNTANTSGGGAFISKASEINTYQCDVINNSCNNGNGGGLYIENIQDLILEAFKIENNSANNGAGIYITNAKRTEIQQCIIYNNQAFYNGGAIFLKDAESTKLMNLLVSENDADLDGGGIFFENCITGVNIIFCTFARNSSKRSAMDTGIIYLNNTPARIINSILWNDGYNEIESVNIDQYPLSITYSDVQMSYTNNVYDGEGNINKDPIFENDSRQDSRYLHLDDLNDDLKSSPCINSGILEEGIPQVDLYHVNRTKHGKSADMGAIEYITRGAELNASSKYGRDPLLVDFDCIAGENKPYTYSIDFGDGSEIVENSNGSFSHRYSGGLFYPECTIILKHNPTIYSIPDTVTINVSSFEWRFDTGGAIESSPAIGHDGSIYVGSDSGAMFGVNTDGTKKWRFQTGGRIVSSPSVYSNTVIFGSEDKSVYKVNAKTGTKIWRFETSGEIYSSPAIDKSGNIYIGSCDSHLYAITPDGQKKWSFLTNNRVISSPSIVYYTNKFDNTINTIYIGSQDNHLYALDLETGTLEWSFDVGADVWGSPAISDDRSIYVAGAEALGDAHQIHLFALNPNGTIKWKHEMLRGAYASPILFSGTASNQTVGMVLMGSYDNNLYNLSFSGYEKWAFPTQSDYVRPADILSSPAVGSSGIIYFGSENHYIYAIEQEKGRIRWSYKTEGPVYSSPVIDNNVLYVGSFDHYLYAIRTNDETLSETSPWPVYHQNPAHHSCLTIFEETMPPTIQKTYPAHNETGLAANVPITLSVTFTKLMDEDTIDISFESALESNVLPSNKIKCDKIFVDDRQVTVASFQPLSSTLEPDTRYKIKISSTAVDEKMNKMQGDWIWVFYSETTEDKADSSGIRGCFIDSVLYNYKKHHVGWYPFFQCQQSIFQVPTFFDVHSNKYNESYRAGD